MVTMTLDPKDPHADPPTTEAPAVRRLSAGDAHALIAEGRGVLVDARSRHLYDNVHADGAVSLPLSEIEAANGRVVIDSIPPDGVFILYCA
jgi:rhodanese-related sulfurtransferase